MQEFSHERPCHPSDLTKFRQRIGEDGVNTIFFVSVKHMTINFNHPKRRKAARKALKRLSVIAFKLMRELQRKLSPAVLAEQEANFALYTKVLNQQPKGKNKIYSLHEPQVYCVGKGKDHKPYEYGAKASLF